MSNNIWHIQSLPRGVQCKKSLHLSNSFLYEYKPANFNADSRDPRHEKLCITPFKIIGSNDTEM